MWLTEVRHRPGAGESRYTALYRARNMVNWKLLQQETWWGSTTPATLVTLSTYTYIGIVFSPTVDGFLYGLSHYYPGNNPARWCGVWEINDQTRRFQDTFNGGPSGSKVWQNVWFGRKFPVVAGNTYQAAFMKWVGYHRTVNALTAPVTHGNIQFIHSFQSTSINPVDVAPTSNNNANGIDVLFLTE